jgi:hypothetical protein
MLKINEAIFVQSLNEYLRARRILYQVQKFSIQLLFVLFQFKRDQIVCDIPNITVTYP